MAIVGNVATEIGDVLQIETSVPIVGIITLTGFTDVTPGVSGTRFFNKTFRYSIDGIQFSPWIPLTVPNLTGISVGTTDIFFLQYRYERAGTSASGTLAFNEVDVSGTFEEQDCGPAYDNSIFSLYFDCLDAAVLTWSISVLEKIYEDGLLPKYIVRNEGGDDTDFIEFWRPITIFFAYLVELARQFENFSSDEELLREFLEERGLYFCGDEDLTELRDIMSNFYREIQKRGTLLIVDDGGVEPKGELLRLICKKPLDFFQLVYNKPEHASFNINNSSPLSRSTEGKDGFDLSYEPGQDFTDISKYPIIDPGSKVTISSPDLLLTGINSGEDAGIGANEEDKRILIDPQLDYILSFNIEADVTTDMLTVGLLGFTSTGSVVTLRNMLDGSVENDFVVDYGLNIADQEYTIKAILFNKDKANDPESILNIGTGRNLRSVATLKFIIPFIVVNPTSGSITAKVRKLRFQVNTLPFAHGYVNAKHFTDFIMKNNNGNLTDAKVRAIMREELVPANTDFQNLQLI